MIFNHCLIWLLTGGSYKIIHQDHLNYLYDNPFMLQLFNLSGNLSMCIPIAAGLVFRANLSAYFEDNRLLNYPYLKLFSVVFTLFLLEYIQLAISYDWYHLGTWNVLKLIASGYLISILLSKINIHLLLFFSGFSLLITNWARPILRGSGSFLELILLGDGGRYFFWPILPWVTFVCMGFWFYHMYEKGTWRKNKLPVLVSSIILFLSINLSNLKYYLDFRGATAWGDGVFQPPVIYLVEEFLFFIILYYLCDFISSRLKFRKSGIIETFSRGILVIYFTHIIIGSYLVRYLDRYYVHNPLITLFGFFLSLVLISWGISLVSTFLLEKKKVVIRISRV